MNGWKMATLASLLTLGIVIGSNAARGAGDESQPLMNRALTQLKAAKLALATATHDKGGHRVKALELVNAAIVEVEAGIAFDDVHGRK